jgi:hypothetical protein
LPTFNNNDRDLGYWELPRPKKGKEREWHVIARVSKRVPYGYEIHPDNENLLRPIPEQLEALELAKRHLKQYSLRDVARWLTKQTGREISHAGLKQRIEIERRRKKATTIKRNLAKRLEAALQEIEKLEKGRVGAYSDKE